MTFVLKWTGATDQHNFQTAGNWLDLGTSAAALAGPATGDTVNIVDTNHLINAGLSNTAVDLAFLNIGGDFTGQVGTSGSPLLIAVSSGTQGVFTYDARASLCNISAGTNGIDKAVIRGSGTVAFVGGTTVALSVAIGGTADIQAAAVVTGITNTGGTITAAAGTAFTTSLNGAGNLISARSLGTSIIGSGLVQTTGVAGATAVTVTSTGRLNTQSTGTFTLITALAGARVDAAGALLPVTVTTLKLSDGAHAYEKEMVQVTVGATQTDGYQYI